MRRLRDSGMFPATFPNPAIHHFPNILPQHRNIFDIEKIFQASHGILSGTEENMTRLR